MSPIMMNDCSPESAPETATDAPMNDAQGGEMSALAMGLSQPPQTTTTASLLGAVKAKGAAIRNYIDAGGSWDDLVPALAKDLNQVVNRKSLETYMAKHHPRRPKASPKSRPIVPDFKAAPAGSPGLPLVRQAAAPTAIAGASAPVPPASPGPQKLKSGGNRFVGPR